MNKKRAKTLQMMKKCIPIYLMALPGLIYLFINNYMPLPGLVLAFKNYNARKGIWGSAWAGLTNFKYLFATSDAYVITRNTILYNLAFIVINTVLSIAVAIILSELKKKIKNFYQSVILLPHLISAVIISYIVFAFLSTESGFFNNTMRRLFGTEPIAWYAEKKYWPFILIFVSAWKSVGYQCIIYLATLLGFDRSFYEAAELDGCNHTQIFFKITLPLIRPILSYTMITSLIGGLQMFDVPQILTNGTGDPARNTMTLIMYLNKHLYSKNYGMAGALSVYLFIISGILCFVVYRMMNDDDADGSKAAAKKAKKAARKG